MVSNQFFDRLLGMIRVLAFGWWDVVEVAVDPFGVVPMNRSQVPVSVIGRGGAVADTGLWG